MLSAVSSILGAIQLTCYAAAYIHGVRLTAQYRHEIADELRNERFVEFSKFACVQMNIDCTNVLKQPTPVAEDYSRAASRSFVEVQKLFEPYEFMLFSLSNSTWASRQSVLQSVLPVATIACVGVLVIAVVFATMAWPTIKSYKKYSEFKAQRQARLSKFSRSSIQDIINSESSSSSSSSNEMMMPGVLDMSFETNDEYSTTPPPPVPQTMEGVPPHLRYRVAGRGGGGMRQMWQSDKVDV